MDSKRLDGIELGFAYGCPSQYYTWRKDDTFVGMFGTYEVWIETGLARWEPWFYNPQHGALSTDELGIKIEELPWSIRNFLVLRKLKGESYDDRFTRNPFYA